MNPKQPAFDHEAWLSNKKVKPLTNREKLYNCILRTKFVNLRVTIMSLIKKRAKTMPSRPPRDTDPRKKKTQSPVVNPNKKLGDKKPTNKTKYGK